MSASTLEQHLHQLIDELSAALLDDSIELLVPDVPEVDDRLDGLFSTLPESAAPKLLAAPPPPNEKAPAAKPAVRPKNTPPPQPPTNSDSLPQLSLMSQLSQWGVDPLLETLAGGDQQLAAAALINLLQKSQATNRHLLAISRQPASAAIEQGGAVYVSHLVGLKFVYVSPGPFPMGNDPSTDDQATPDEQPQHRVHLPGFWISRYPITTAAYHKFLINSGYRPQGPTDNSPGGTRPVTDVTWADALAYCHWLTERSGLPVSLPSEAEWEKAARGSDGRRYPWGNQSPASDLCSFFHAAPVGQFSPRSDSPYGCADMAGNVWEWTRSRYRPYPYRPKDGREAPTGDEALVVRGLTFNNPLPMTRSAFRYRVQPVVSLPALGFRVAISPDAA
ncbi:MAG: hypothetical protein Kow0031_25900 [Anaerolineae bacterium]